jgi:hypothetical protein
MSQQFTTRQDAIQTLILDALGTEADAHDVESIADEVLGDYSQGYAQQVDVDTFWEIVSRHAR